MAGFASLRPFVVGGAVFGDGKRRLAAEESRYEEQPAFWSQGPGPPPVSLAPG